MENINYYYMNKECGNLVTWEEMWEEAEELGYDDMCDPCSCEYGNWQLHYECTLYKV